MAPGPPSIKRASKRLAAAPGQLARLLDAPPPTVDRWASLLDSTRAVTYRVGPFANYRRSETGGRPAVSLLAGLVG